MRSSTKAYIEYQRNGFKWSLVLILCIILALFSITAVASGAKGQLELSVVDGKTGLPLVVRMHLKNDAGRAPRIPKVPNCGDHFVFVGEVVLSLSPGNYTFEIERGPEYPIQTGYFELKSGDLDSKVVTMRRFVDMAAEGWWSGDLALFRNPLNIEVLMLADDLHVAQVVTWTNEKKVDLEALLKTFKKRVTRFDHNRFYDILAGVDDRNGGAVGIYGLEKPLPIEVGQSEYPPSAAILKKARSEGAMHLGGLSVLDADLPVWIAGSLIDSVGLAHSQLQRNGVGPDDRRDHSRDLSRYPKPHGSGQWAEKIYYHLLNTGIRIPPTGISGSGRNGNPPGYNRVYVWCGKEMTWDRWWANLKKGHVVVTNGPMLRARATAGYISGEGDTLSRRPYTTDKSPEASLPGTIFKAPAGSHLEITISADMATRDRVEHLEVIKNGQVAHRVPLDFWVKANGDLPALDFKESGWFLVRAVTDNDRTYRYATTGPFYVEIDDKPRISGKSVQFFIDWTFQRAKNLKVENPQHRARVLQFLKATRNFWNIRLTKANAR